MIGNSVEAVLACYPSGQENGSVPISGDYRVQLTGGSSCEADFRQGAVVRLWNPDNQNCYTQSFHNP